MNKRINLTTIARTFALAALIAIGGQLAMPVLAHAKSAKCVAVPIPGKPGQYLVQCSTIRP